MPYISTDQVKEIRQALKAKFPKFKFSVRRDNGTSVRVAIMKGPLLEPDGSQSVNQYHIDSQWADRPEWCEFLKGVKDIVAMNRKIMYHDYDYGDIPNYYYDITIGKWDQKYQTI